MKDINGYLPHAFSKPRPIRKEKAKGLRRVNLLSIFEGHQGYCRVGEKRHFASVGIVGSWRKTVARSAMREPSWMSVEILGRQRPENSLRPDRLIYGVMQFDIRIDAVLRRGSFALANSAIARADGCPRLRAPKIRVTMMSLETLSPKTRLEQH